MTKRNRKSTLNLPPASIPEDETAKAKRVLQAERKTRTDKATREVQAVLEREKGTVEIYPVFRFNRLIPFVEIAPPAAQQEIVKVLTNLRCRLDPVIIIKMEGVTFQMEIVAMD